MKNDYYHIRITLTAKDRHNNNLEISENDITIDNLKKSYTEPYKNGQQIYHSGNFIDSTSIQKIIIRKSDKPFIELYNEAGKNGKSNGSKNSNLTISEQFILCQLPDVTNDFLVGLPGYSNSQNLTRDELITKLQELGLSWEMDDVDLLQLIVALDELEAIHLDGKKADRKELYDIFRNLLHVKLKTPESKISHSKGNKKVEKHFLEELKQAWESARNKTLNK